ncbi:MAG: hypothetical protein GY816_02740 [Cytophagales bacterium]|nr:hypothetical protein [Cytophagales bacterium]
MMGRTTIALDRKKQTNREETDMKWSEIRTLYPDKFILLGDIVEEKISETEYRITEGNILKVY